MKEFPKYLDHNVVVSFVHSGEEKIDSFTGEYITSYWTWTQDHGWDDIIYYSAKEPVQKKDLWYLQNGYSGDAIIWWAETGSGDVDSGGSGYTTDINKAALFTEEGMKNTIRTNERGWKCSEVDGNKEAKRVVVYSHYLNYENKYEKL